MAESLGTTALGLKAVATSDVLALAVTIPRSGWLAERFGSRPVFPAAMLFTPSSLVFRSLKPDDGDNVSRSSEPHDNAP
ncbi:MAG: hypothetical protein WAQ05_13730 [Rubrivivax sp.]